MQWEWGRNEVRWGRRVMGRDEVGGGEKVLGEEPSIEF